MRQFPLLVVAIFFCLFTCVATAQSPALICVGTMARVSVPDALGQELLLKAFNKAKDKSVAQELPIDASEAERALPEAKRAHCDYLLTTNQTESHQENSLMSGAAFGNTVTPTFYVTTAYRLTTVSDGSEVASGNFKAADHASEQAALSATMHKIANKVLETIKKSAH